MWTARGLRRLTVLCGALGCGISVGQTPGCGVAPLGLRAVQPNIFSEQQEIWLGQVEADLTEGEIRPVRDPSLSAHLQAIADRLVAVLPPTKIQFRVTMIDSNELNGFSIAGGHIYITRKLAAAAQNDDELAGVIGHEMGHIISHQFGFDTTREMKRLLNVTSVGNEADIRKKYEAMLDAEYRDKHPELGETDADQAEADQIGLYAMTAAGYRPQAYAEFWDRTFFVEGKIGSRLGDLLGMTKPSQKRLRSMYEMIAALPPGCGRNSPPDEKEFAQWHQLVVANQKGTESLRSDAISEVTLTPPLRMGLSQVRFSPDGKSILAQDESSIFVLSREPLAVRYRIDASGALPANFSPDSQSITFSTPGLHIEQWSVKEKKLLAAREMFPRKTCYDSRLAPDGRTLVCVEFDIDQHELALALLDTTTSEVVWENKNWMQPGYQLALSLFLSKTMELSSPVFLASYSPDGNTLLFAGGVQKVAFDLRDRTVMSVGNGLRDLITGAYAFVGNDKVAGVNLFDTAKSNILSFPGGKVLERVNMPFTEMAAVSNPGISLNVLTYGLKDYGVGLCELSGSKLVMAVNSRALDEYDQTIATETLGGGLAVGPVGNVDAKKMTRVELPLSPLPWYPVTALSKDGKYLALSTKDRGELWDLASGKEVGMVYGFTDALWTDDDTLFLDIAKNSTGERHMAMISTASRTLKKLDYKVDDETHMRYGRLTDWKLDKKQNAWTLALHDPADDKVVWTRSFPDKFFSYTASYGDRDLIFNFELNSHMAKEAMKANPALAAQAQGIKDKKSAALIKILSGKTGEDAGSLVVELPPNFSGTDGLNRARDLLYVQGYDDRTAVYSILTGKQVLDLIGYVRALDPATGRVLTVNRVGEGTVYDAKGVELAHYLLGDPIRFALFRENAGVVTILTADQKVRTLKVGSGESEASAAAASSSK